MTTKVAKSSNRGAKPGERRGGRQKGTPNKSTASLKEMAREYTDRALLTLADVMTDEDQPAAARVAASKELLDRGYGKASTVLSGDEDGGPIKLVGEVRLVGVRPDGNG